MIGDGWMEDAVARRIYSLFIITLLHIFRLAANCGAVEFATIEKVWKQREAETSLVTIKWSESRVSRAWRSFDTETQNVPEFILRLKGGKALFDDVATNTRSDGRLQIIQQAYNGEGGRQLLINAQNVPNGVILRGAPNLSAGTLPLLLLYRGANDMLCNCPLSEFGAPNPPPTVAPNGDILLHAKDSAHKALRSQDWELRLRPELGYAPVRLIGTKAGKAYFDMTIDVGMTDGRLVPKKWSWTAYSTFNGAFIHAAKGMLISCDFTTEVEDAVFDLEFPPGTIVADMRTKREGWSDRYLQTEAGKKRPILKAELQRGAKYEELLRTRPGLAGLPPIAPWRVWLLCVNVVVVVCLIVAILIQRYRSRRVC